MKKNEYIKFRVSLEDKREIKRLAHTLGYDSVSDYLFSISLSGINKYERILIFNELHNLRVKNARVENNINQIAKHLNIHKNISEELMKQFIDLFEDFSYERKEQNNLINSVINKLHKK